MCLIFILLLIFPTLAIAQEITKIDSSSYTKTTDTIVNIAEKQNECDAIQAQFNSLQERLNQCNTELDVAKVSEVGKPVDITPTADIATPDDIVNP